MGAGRRDSRARSRTAGKRPLGHVHAAIDPVADRPEGAGNRLLATDCARRIGAAFAALRPAPAAPARPPALVVRRRFVLGARGGLRRAAARAAPPSAARRRRRRRRRRGRPRRRAAPAAAARRRRRRALGGGAAGSAAVSTGFAPSRRRYSSTAAIPAASVTRRMARRQKREPDGAALARAGRRFPSRFSAPAAHGRGGQPGNDVLQRHHHRIRVLEPLRRLLRHRLLDHRLKQRRAASPGRTFASDGTGCVRCAPM